jgi:hypothetical protein
VGSRVRAYVPVVFDSREVASASLYHTGTVTEMDSVSLTLREADGTEFRAPFTSLRELKLSGGVLSAGDARRRGTLRGGVIGAGLGLGGVGLLAGILAMGDKTFHSPDCGSELGVPCLGLNGHTEIRPAGAAIAVVVGGAFGALAGASLSHTGRERWIGVPLRALRVQPSRAGAAGAVGLSLQI